MEIELSWWRNTHDSPSRTRDLQFCATRMIRFLDSLEFPHSFSEFHRLHILNRRLLRNTMAISVDYALVNHLCNQQLATSSELVALKYSCIFGLLYLLAIVRRSVHASCCC